MSRLPTKDPAEVKLVRFPFAAELEAGVTVASVAITAATLAGTDPAPEAILNGAAVVDAATQDVLQRVTGGLDACDYKLRALATDTTGLVHLVTATLPVRNL